MSYINNKNEHFSGSKTFDKISKTKHKNFDIFGSSGADHLTLDALSRTSGNVKDNPNIEYFGYGGFDMLEYSGGGVKSVKLSVLNSTTVFSTGGYSTGGGFDSLDVWAYNVEGFNLTGQNDDADFRGLGYGVLVEAAGGNDEITGTYNHDTIHGGSDNDWISGSDGWDHLYGDDGKDTIYGGSGDDWVEGGDGADLLHGGVGEDSIFGGDGNDTIDAGSNNDTVYGGSGADSITAGGGNDTIDADIGSDTVYGGTGDDTIDVGGLDNADQIVHGGSGSDVIMALAEINKKGDTEIWGDGHDDENNSRQSSYNEADMFFIGAASTTIEMPSFPNNSAEEEYDTIAGYAINAGTTIVKASPLGSLGSIGASIGFSLAAEGLKDVILGGANADAGVPIITTSASQVYINDFDIWADTAVIALDGNADDVTGLVTFDATKGASLQFTVESYKFLTLTLDQTTTSILENEASISASFMNNAGIKQELLNNMILNSLVVQKTQNSDGSWSTTAKTLSGIDMVLDDPDSSTDDEQGELRSMLSTSGEDGVWIMGNFGNSILYGNSNSLAGTNSDNVMYSGRHAGEGFGDLWYADEATFMYGGQGSDVIFGSTVGGDRLYGGEGDDYINGVGVSLAGGDSPDEIYGGQGNDVASFAAIYAEDDSGNSNQVGGYGYKAGSATTYLGIAVDLSNDNTVYQIDSTQWGYFASEMGSNGHINDMPTTWTDGSAVYGDKAANLYEIEGVEGTDNADVLVGDNGANVLIGNAGSDLLVGNGGDDELRGNAGKDRYFGGSGADTFIFDGSANTGQKVWWETIYDFAVGEDSIRLEGTRDKDFGQLSIFNVSGGAIVNYGDGSILVENVSAADLNSDHFVFG